MEKLVAARRRIRRGRSGHTASSPQDLAACCAKRWRSNTIGGRAGEESKWRAMAEEVRQAQSAFARLVPVPGETGRQLNERFHKACNRFFDQYRRKVPPAQQTPRGRQWGEVSFQASGFRPDYGSRTTDYGAFHFLKRTFPPTIGVQRLPRCGISSSGTFMMSFESTAMSAYLPAFSEPRGLFERRVGAVERVGLQRFHPRHPLVRVEHLAVAHLPAHGRVVARDRDRRPRPARRCRWRRRRRTSSASARRRPLPRARFAPRRAEHVGRVRRAVDPLHRRDDAERAEPRDVRRVRCCACSTRQRRSFLPGLALKDSSKMSSVSRLARSPMACTHSW